MKRAVLVLILLSAFVNAASLDIELGKGVSYEFQGKNITVLNFNEKDDKVVLCINNVKTIMSRGNNKVIDNLNINLRGVNNGVAKFRLDGSCRNCECDENCNNKLCVVSSSDTITSTDEETSIEENNEEIYLNAKNEPIEESDFMLLSSVLIIAVVILGVIVFVKRSVF